MKHTTAWIFAASLITAAGSLALPQIVMASDKSMQGGMSSMKTMPQTAEEHAAMADAYKAKAASYRQDAEHHRQMLADYKRKGVATVGPRGTENPWLADMRKHCEKYIADAQSLASDAEDFAKFHTMRGQEVGGGSPEAHR